jgi:hypothetical protein
VPVRRPMATTTTVTTWLGLTQRGAPTRRARDASNTTSDAYSASPEIAESNDGRVVDDGTDKRPRPFVFDVFAEDDDELVNNGQPPAKRQRRASSSVRTEQARTPPVVNLPHDVELHADFTRKEETMEGSRVAGSAHCRRATDTVGAGVRSQLGEDAVAT